MKKQITYSIKGMVRDVDISHSNNEFSYENMNIRITAREDGTLMAVTNEKGTLSARSASDLGILLGYCVLNKFLITFEIVLGKYAIKKYTYNSSSERLTLEESLIDDSLNFNIDNPIEAIGIYESELIQKVYFVDGLNQPRVINILNLESNRNKYNFILDVKTDLVLNINKEYSGGGQFPSGVVQYAFSYYNKYKQESKLVYISPIHYISSIDRGNSSEEVLSNAFKLTLDNIDTNFDCIRIYSIVRTSINTTPTVKRLCDISLDNITKYKAFIASNVFTSKVKDYGEVIINGKDGKIYNIDNAPGLVDYDTDMYGMADYYFNTDNIQSVVVGNTHINLSNYTQESFAFKRESFDFPISVVSINNFDFQCTEKYTTIDIIDTNQLGEVIDPTLLLYIGGESIIANTITHKDGTLFLGNIKYKENKLKGTTLSDINNYVSGIDFKFQNSDYKSIANESRSGYYSYNNSLSGNMDTITTFKYGECYRIGIIFTFADGSTSKPFFIGDFENSTRILSYFNESFPTKLIEGYCRIDNYNNVGFLNLLYSSGVRGITPVIVYPTIYDRNVVCQGVLNPTVYNIKDRCDNAPYVQSSWFFRPDAPVDIIGNAKDFEDYENYNYYPSVNSKGGQISNDKTNEVTPGEGTLEVNSVPYGAWLEFRHNYPIPGNNKRNAEIQCIDTPASSPLLTGTITDVVVRDFIDKHSECYFVDRNLLTFHSPDLEFDDRLQNISYEGCKLRLIGMVPITSNENYIGISTESDTQHVIYNSRTLGLAPYKISSFAYYGKGYTSKISGRWGWKSLVSGAFWVDILYDTKSSSLSVSNPVNYMLYPWQKEGSLNNGDTYAKLKSKKISNLKYSYNSIYFNTDRNKILNSLRDVKVITQDNPNTKLKIRGGEYVNYYGNIDKLETYHKVTSTDKGYGYCLSIDGVEGYIYNTKFLEESTIGITNKYYCTDPCRIKYNSGIHAILSLGYSDTPSLDTSDRILPLIRAYNSNHTGPIAINSTTKIGKEIWNRLYRNASLSIPTVDTDFRDNADTDEFNYSGYTGNDYSPTHGFLWLGEIIRTNVPNRFGGTSDEALQNNQWIVCGETVSIKENTQFVELYWRRGDTYYQRYDHLKTYPDSLDNTNCITETLSFRCETRINIDGRYDKNRGDVTNITVNSDNTNLLNIVYSQEDNYITHRILPDFYYENDTFNNLVVWSKEKQFNNITDNWTDINLTSSIELDGDKGTVNRLYTYNNEIYCLQDRGFSNILFNSRVQIPTTDGVPIELGNSNKVLGKRYISSNTGCSNKWASIVTPRGIYFVDDNECALYNFNGQLNNVSNNLGFKVWFKDNTKKGIWKVGGTSDALRLDYDIINNDLYLTNKDISLVYSELLNSFTSFMSYGANNGMFNFGNGFYSSAYNFIYKHNVGNYNYLYGVSADYYITYRIAPEPTQDKIFDNVELRMDCTIDNVLQNKIFNHISVSNEYQEASSILNRSNCKPSNLKQKFRIWRINLPRCGRDRIRNPWITLTLKSTKENNTDKHKAVLHNMTMSYYI